MSESTPLANSYCTCGQPGSCCRHSGSSSTSPSAASRQLPLNRHKGGAQTYGSVWSIDQDQTTATPPTREEQLGKILGDTQPLAHKCGKNNGGTCCKDLKGDDERHLISPEIVRDVIIGLSDGLTVPFALTAGLSSLGSSRLVVTGGLAELCAGALSMGLGGYLASKAELDHFRYLRRQTRDRVRRSCAGEMEREVHSILGPLGVKEPLSRLVTEDLRAVEDRQASASHGLSGLPTTAAEGVQAASPVVRDGAAARKGWWRWGRGSQGQLESEEGDEEDTGLSAFLLKFGEGMEEVPVSRLYISAITIGLSYFIGGLIPLVPYMAKVNAQEGLMISCIVTGVVLLIFGAFKTYFTGATGGVGGYIYGSVSTALVGGLAAGAAFGLVKALGVQE